MEHNFRFIDLATNSVYFLNKNDDVGIKSLLSKNVHCFYTHFGYLHTLATRSNADIGLAYYFTKAILEDLGINGLSVIQGTEDLPSVLQQKLLVLITSINPGDAHQNQFMGFDRSKEFLGRLHQEFKTDDFEHQSSLIFTQPTLWDFAFLHGDQSLVTQNPFFHQYLIWDDGGLWNENVWGGDSKQRLAKAWRGAGWLSQRMQHLSFDELCLNRLESSQCELSLRRMQGLIRDLRAYEAGGLSDEKIDDGYLLLKTLCAFLPNTNFVDGSWGMAMENSRYDAPGGPVPYGDHSDFDTYQRVLFFEGWLSLWPAKTEDWEDRPRYWLQPSSLALLYWAANQMDYPNTKSVGDFLNGYDWFGKYGATMYGSEGAWFSGRLSEE